MSSLSHSDTSGLPFSRTSELDIDYICHYLFNGDFKMVRNPQGQHEDDLMADTLPPPVVVHHAPFALQTSPFPRRFYQQALDLQPIWNELVIRMSQDDTFIDDMVSR